jgi:cytochrome c biogenesis protein CcdA
MLENITNSFRDAAMMPIGLVLALILGFVSAGASVCCTMPALAIVVGYSSSRSEATHRAALRSTLFFALGIVLSLMIIGGVAGFVGQVAQISLGKYWKVFAGVIAILFGLATLNLLPFKLSLMAAPKTAPKTKTLETALAGILLGGVIAACSLPCNPGALLVIGTAILLGKVVWATLLLLMFAIGFSLPLAAIMLGVSLGRVSLNSKRVGSVVRWLAGIVLLVVGFYFIITY